MRSSREIADIAQFEAAARLLNENRPGDAQRLLCAIIAAHPRSAEARWLLGLAFHQLNDPGGAEREFRAGFSINPAHESSGLALADVLTASQNRLEAERVLCALLGAAPASVPAAIRLSELLLAAGRYGDAIKVTARLAAAAAPDHSLLAQHATALKAFGRPDDALEVHQRAAVIYPDSIVAHHNLAATLGDLARFEAAESSATRAFALGGTAPQTWLVYARALLGQNRLDDAERAFNEAIRRQPDYAEAHRDLAQLIWMRTEDANAATAQLDTAIRAAPQTYVLLEIKATTLEFAGDIPASYATIQQAIACAPRVAALHSAAAHLALRAGDRQAGLRHAEAAVALAPVSRTARDALFVSCAAIGDVARAAEIAGRLVEEQPFDQRALTLQATAWRLLGDPRYAARYDYDALVRAWTLDVPDGWLSLEAYLADLATALTELHPFKTHPLEQSLRHGSQAPHLKASTNAVIQAFFQAVDGPIRRHLAALGTGSDPVRSRNTGGFDFQGVWSVRLRPGGFHTDHVHPQGWLSSACYVSFPQGTASGGREGWIKFGEPGIATEPRIGPEHFIQPQPGMLVLFPSYMWHGTVPFSGEQPRLTVAFDLQPRPS